eukprot:m.12786 g.12786  ORF g.12786 m.12786 type:complete len:50 (+) comp10028_c0_seq1:570-719(+)
MTPSKCHRLGIKVIGSQTISGTLALEAFQYLKNRSALVDCSACSQMYVM